MMMWMLSMASAIFASDPIQILTEVDSNVIRRGDIVYVKTSFRNQSDRTLELENPIGDMNYQLFLDDGRKKAGFFALLGMGIPGKKVVKVGDELSEVRMMMPWHLLQRQDISVDEHSMILDDSTVVRSKLLLRISGKSLTSVDDFVPSPKLPRLSATEKNTIIYSESDQIEIAVDGAVLKSKPQGLLYRKNNSNLSGHERTIQELEWSFKRLKKPMRMSPVAAKDFDLLLDWELVPLENLRRFHSTINSESNLYCLVHVILRCNDWVTTEDETGRDEIEKELLSYVEKRPPIERKFLRARLKRIFDTRDAEVGKFDEAKNKTK